MSTRTLQRAFSGGEVSPEFYARIDDAKYQTGVGTMRNFIALPHGPATSRPGTRFVRAVKDSTKKVRLIPFTYSTTQTLVIEMGAGYFRFHTQGATIMSGSSPYEIANPFAEADLFDIHYVQSNDVLTLVHPNYAPRELRRYGLTNWQLITINFNSPISAPTGGTATAYIPSSANVNDDTKVTMYYVVTAIASDGISESSASSPASCVNNIYVTGAYNTITWTARTGATRYYVYKMQGGIYGYIGQTTGTSLVDDNIAPDLGKTPPIYNNDFTSSGSYPGAVSYFEQRRCFAGTLAEPQKIWMTKSATESNMSYCLPSQETDRIEFRVAAREANTIRHIVPLSQLILLTSAAEWRVTSVNSDAITPTSVSVKPQSYVGASNVQPIVVNNSMLYAAARGGHVRELGYSWQSNGFITGDVSVRATHLFDHHSIRDMAFSKAPYPIAWAVRNDGVLLGLTYMPEQQIGAWHQHDTDSVDPDNRLGQFESVAVVAEGDDDVPYFVVRRYVNGAWVRYIERLPARIVDPVQYAFYVDCGLSYDGKGTSTIRLTGGTTWGTSDQITLTASSAIFQTDISAPASMLFRGDSTVWSCIYHIRKVGDEVWSFNDFTNVTNGSGYHAARISRLDALGNLLADVELPLRVGQTWQMGAYSLGETDTHFYLFGVDAVGAGMCVRVSKSNPTDQSTYAIPDCYAIAYQAYDNSGAWVRSTSARETFKFWSYTTHSYTGQTRVGPDYAPESDWQPTMSCAAHLSNGDFAYLSFNSNLMMRLVFVNQQNIASYVSLAAYDQPIALTYDSDAQIIWVLTSAHLMKISTVSKTLLASHAVSGIDRIFAGNLNYPYHLGLDKKNGMLFWLSNVNSGSESGVYLRAFDIATGQVSSSPFPPGFASVGAWTEWQYEVAVFDGCWWIGGYLYNDAERDGFYALYKVAPPYNKNVGDVIYVNASDGTQYALTIVSVISTTQAIVQPNTTIGYAYRDVTLSDWSFAHKHFSGLSHLEGRVVNILADGAVHPQRPVIGGEITLDVPASVVQVGLPILADVRTLPVILQVDALGQGRYKNINRAHIRLCDSAGISIGPNLDNLVEYSHTTLGTPADLMTGEVRLMISPSWNESGQIWIRQSDPLPATLVGLTLEVAIGA